MGAYLLAVWCLSWTQDGQNAMASIGIIDMDGKEAALVVMCIEQRQLLVAVYGVGGVVDVEGDSLGCALVTLAPQIHHGPCHSDQRAWVGGILPTRHCGLRCQVIAAFRQSPTGQFERRIPAQIVQIIGIGVSAGNG